jgi:signal transduction histidine kinase
MPPVSEQRPLSSSLTTTSRTARWRAARSTTRGTRSSWLREAPRGREHPGPRDNRGLGLTFCQLAVEAHGGRIWVEDAAPGTRFA